MTTVYDKNDVSLYRVRMDQKDYRWIAVAKDDNGAIELCRAIVRLEREGHIVQDVFAVSPNGVSVAMNLRGFKEFRQAEKEPETKVVDAMFRRYCASGAYLDSHCKADLCSHRVFDVEICGAIADDDEIGECEWFCMAKTTKSTNMKPFCWMTNASAAWSSAAGSLRL